MGDRGPGPTADSCPTGDASPTADPGPTGDCRPGPTDNVDPAKKEKYS